MKAEEFIAEFKNRGFYYSNDLIFNYFNSLITKPFVILTGISGSGKSKIAEIFATVYSTDGERQFELVPVKPNWRDSKGLFGFHNLIGDNYYITPVISLFLRALKNPERPYFLILDEMNIAKTEHYFADYLSLIESRRYETAPLTTLDELRNLFSYPTSTSLSEAIILSAIDINKPNVPLAVEEYRKNKFSVLWRETFSSSDDKNWTPQFRSELNQGPNRLANRVFTGGEGRYCLKEKSQMHATDLSIVNKLENLYSQIKSRNKTIIQSNMVLHNNPVCLGVGNNPKCDSLNCPYKASKKYQCPRLYTPETDTYLIPPELPIPLNVFTIGTVNIDETTYMFSPKVLDRSNVIEFNEVDFSTLYDMSLDMREIACANGMLFVDERFYFDVQTEMPEMKITLPSVENVNLFSKNNPDEFTDLLQIFSSLKKYNLQFGYRVMNEIASYVCNISKNTSYSRRAGIALDLQLLQKVLPKFFGSYDKLWPPLVDILNICLKKGKSYSADMDAEELNLELSKEQIQELFKYPRTSSKILSMLNELNKVGFATFIR